MVTFFVKKALSQQFNSHQFAEIEVFFVKNQQLILNFSNFQTS